MTLFDILKSGDKIKSQSDRMALFEGMMMSGFELRLWRRGMGWDQERAAEELGISLRTYKRYEKKAETGKLLELATEALTRRAG
ncbi:helix-turn-helix transcriptional regulator [Escherichia marmotae]|nr:MULTISPECIES: helix-turn-helix transcriptional regulator [Escherichia]KXQ91788.1 hypothetical protein AUQ17_23500 [Escherichia coli]MCW9946282.1 helix-turn-helix domain-containing protein [Escherichia coli]MEC9630088.1 helix-turn-helix transcriptional regulator [Escherichia marmotae]MEC9697810.1 helix-turn-helix transcriptional regulator [Escherichia marmotae]MEC9825144.1 helix-turn-helix transcriptional regulator [Escherichia marmotae]